MSMDQSAIQQIQASVVVESLNATLNEHALDRPVVATPDDFKLNDLECYMRGRVRYRGKMNTAAIDAFVAFSKEHDTDGARCFVDAAGMDAKAFFNLGTEDEPGHADFTAYVKLEKTAEFKALLEIDGKKLTQKTLAEWLEDWQEYVQPYNGEGEAVDIVKAIAAVRRIEINASRKEDHDEQQFRASRSALESVEARSDHGMPAGFRFTCIPYQGLEKRSFEVRLSILTGDDKPVLVTRIRRLEQQQENMGNEFMEKLKVAFEENKMNTFLGNFSA